MDTQYFVPSLPATAFLYRVSPKEAEMLRGMPPEYATMPTLAR